MWGTTIGNTNVYPSVTAETFVGSGNIDIAQVQLCAGDVALPFQPKSFEKELRACQRYYEKSYAYSTAVGTATSVGAVRVDSSAGGTGAMFQSVFYKTTKRTTVTPTLYDTAGTVDRVFKGAAGKVAAVLNESDSSFVGGTNDTTSTATMIFQWVVSAEL